MRPGPGLLLLAATCSLLVVLGCGDVERVEFIKGGSELGVNYGTFGVGRGWMPGFGLYVSEADIERIVAFERAL